MSSDYIILACIIITGMLLSILFKKLTIAAAIAGGIIACLVFYAASFTGVIMMATFFLLGTLATSWKIKTKQQLHLAEKNKGKRTVAQVIANAGVAGICGLLAYVYPSHQPLFVLLIAASFASATADTLSSELGNVYGRRFYNILSLKKDTRGLDGVVSIEGTIAGITGSLIIACIYAVSIKWSLNVLWIIVAGTAGNIADSVIGASAERKGLLKNNTVNFLNTLIAACFAALLYQCC